MLIFKKNIYDPPPPHPEDVAQARIDPYGFFLNTLVSDRDIFSGLRYLSPDEALERCNVLFPHAGRFGSYPVLNKISRYLMEGLVNTTGWYQLNAYHFCYLYDSLYSMVEEYSYSDRHQKLDMIPELEGENFDLNSFLNEYFLNTAFLIAPERYNSMPPEEKERLGFSDPCLFGVINRLVPTQEEIFLTPQTENPYTLTEPPN